MFLTGGGLFAQLDCERDLPDDWDVVYPTNAWNAFVFQLNSGYNAYGDRNGREFFAQRDYKGYLMRDGDKFLPTYGLNFDTDFDSNDAQSGPPPGGGGGNVDDANFFETGITPLDDDGCEVRRSHFGLIMRARYVVPETGVYLVTVGSDDGSYMRMFKKPLGVNVLLKDVNGNDLIHDNWVKEPSDTLYFDGLYNFLYEDNIRNYYVELNVGDEIFIDLNYYEKTNVNRLSFNLELYYGPGEIRINNVLKTDSETYCAVTPDPDPFFSQGSAVFENGTLDSYFWEWSLSDDPDGTWTKIEDETGSTYDIPGYSPDWEDEGTKYYRRGAVGTVELGSENQTVTTYSNILEINMNSIAYPEGGLDHHGTEAWHGYFYSGVARNQDDYFGTYPHRFMGKHIVGEDDLVHERFPSPGPDYKFFPNQPGSCGFHPANFSAQFLRKFEVQPGTYEFTVRAHDGYRLFINDILVTTATPDTWNRGRGQPIIEQKITYEALEQGTIDLRLEYYNIAWTREIYFSHVFKALPVEWGQVSGNACGESNCLTWETLQEKNTSHFTVERSYDGQEWTPVGDEVAAQGFSTESNTYQLSDAAFMRERSFYRIKQVDLDGSMDYSETIRIDNHSLRNKLVPYPNPTVDRVRFYSAEEVLMIQVTSHDARVNTRADFEQIDQNIYELDFSQMQNSHYVITVVTKDSRKTHKIIKK